MLVPPTLLALEPTHAAGLVPDLREGEVSPVHPPTDEIGSLCHRRGHTLDEVPTPRSFEAIGITHQPEARGPVRWLPSQFRRMLLVVDRDAHASEVQEVMHGPARGREVEIEQGDGNAVSDDDVLEADVVVTHHGSALRIGEIVTPRPSLIEPSGRVVEPTHLPGDGREEVVALTPQRVRGNGHVALDEAEHLPIVVADADRRRRTFEPGRSQEGEEGVDRASMRVRGADDALADPRDSAGLPEPAGEPLLII